MMQPEADLIVKRSELRQLLEAGITHSQTLSQTLQMSLAWVKKWRKRVLDPGATFASQSRRPHHIHRSITPTLSQQVLQLRAQLPETYHRAVGGRTIRYYLKQMEVFTSASTIYTILHQQGILPRQPVVLHVPFAPTAPMHTLEIDFCDVPSMAANAEKRQHAGEVFLAVDRGTSICVNLQGSTEFDAERALAAVAQLLRENGCPQVIVCDRDPRLVGNTAANGFLSAFQQFLLCLGITPQVLAPQRPQDKPYVERFVQNLKKERLRHVFPQTVTELNQELVSYQTFYNEQRPHQGASCGDQPPRLAFPDAHMARPLPEWVNPDAWLDSLHGKKFARTVAANGTVKVAKTHYFIGKGYAGQRVVLALNAKTRTMDVEIWGRLKKSLRLKGLYERMLPFEEYLNMMYEAARSEWKAYLWRQKAKATNQK